MEVITLHGTEDRLYELVARLVMSPEVLRQNNNYPFKTTPRYVWHLCLCGGEVVGFMPLRPTERGLYLDNYYIREDDPEVLDRLLSHILSVTERPITALSHKRHAEAFRRHGFITNTIFAQYVRMLRVGGRKGVVGE